MLAEFCKIIGGTYYAPITTNCTFITLKGKTKPFPLCFLDFNGSGLLHALISVKEKLYVRTLH